VKSGGGADDLSGVDPALLAMFAARNAERSSGLDAFAAKWGGAAGSKGAKTKKQKRKQK
jgi:hypothetical protein